MPEWIKCIGEAHTNPFIDHCGICMPYWEYYPICDCKARLKKTPKFYICSRKECKKRFRQGDVDDTRKC